MTKNLEKSSDGHRGSATVNRGVSPFHRESATDYTDSHGLGFKICEIRANLWQKELITVKSGATAIDKYCPKLTQS
jgi:hypothetical protein